MQRIGIAACSAEGAALCYRTICSERAHPPVVMDTPPLAETMACIDRGDWAGVGAILCAGVARLAAAGADFVICPDNTIHQALRYFESPLPWLHIADVVTQAARGYARVGLLGTTWLCASDVYPADYVRPAEVDEVSRIIMDELVAGSFRQASIAFLEHVIEGLAARGCDSVVLGCTELPIVLGDHNSALPTLDSTRLLARAAVRRALG